MQTEDEVAIKNLGQGHFCSKVIVTDTDAPDRLLYLNH